jgi:hypothetical protein
VLFLSVFLEVRSHIFPILSVLKILFGILMDQVVVFYGHGKEITELFTALLFLAQSLH